MWSDEEIAGLMDCPRDALPWAGRAYRVGWRDGRYELLTAEAEANGVVAALAASTLKQPPWHEIVHRREPTTEPCRSPGCGGRCSRCIRAYTVQFNRKHFGQDDYPGRNPEQAVA